MSFSDNPSRIYQDIVAVNIRIGGKPWYVKEMRIELSKVSSPDYVDMTIIPDPNETLPYLPSVDRLVGNEVTVDVDNSLLSERDTPSEEVTRLFTGKLANISPTGKHIYEAVIYKPLHQPFNVNEEEGQETGAAINKTIDITGSITDYGERLEKFGRNIGFTQTDSYYIRASQLVNDILDVMNVPSEKRNIRMAEGGETFNGYTGGFDKLIKFDHKEDTIDSILERIRRETKSEWWFDRKGNFNFGTPRPTEHKLRFITNGSAGRTTPPYQSVVVIGSSVASKKGRPKASMVDGNPTVKTATIANVFNEKGATKESGVAKFGIPPEELPEPVYTYRNDEITTDDQAENTAATIIKDLAEQQAEGTVTVVGFPEVTPLDAVKMPNSEIQPMGGYSFGVYKVVHKINTSDGFITEISVGSPVGATRASILQLSDEAAQHYNAVDRTLLRGNVDDEDTTDGLGLTGTTLPTEIGEDDVSDIDL